MCEQNDKMCVDNEDQHDNTEMRDQEAEKAGSDWLRWSRDMDAGLWLVMCEIWGMKVTCRWVSLLLLIVQLLKSILVLVWQIYLKYIQISHFNEMNQVSFKSIYLR